MLALKTEFPWNFSLHWIYFLLFRIFEQLALALKNRVARKFFTVLNILLTLGLLRNLCLPWKTEGALEFFIVLNMYFLSFRIFEQLALALKNRAALEFFTVLKYFFIIQDFWATSACPENRDCPEIFQTGGSGSPPRRPPRTPMSKRVSCGEVVSAWFRSIDEIFRAWTSLVRRDCVCYVDGFSAVFMFEMLHSGVCPAVDKEAIDRNGTTRKMKQILWRQFGFGRRSLISWCHSGKCSLII